MAYREEKLLMELDAHALEEQRYLNRLRNSEMRIDRRTQKHYEKIVLPEIKMKLKQELKEQFLSQKRREQFDRFQIQKRQIRDMLSHMNNHQIMGQMD